MSSSLISQTSDQQVVHVVEDVVRESRWDIHSNVTLSSKGAESTEIVEQTVMSPNPREKGVSRSESIKVSIAHCSSTLGLEVVESGEEAFILINHVVVGKWCTWKEVSRNIGFSPNHVRTWRYSQGRSLPQVTNRLIEWLNRCIVESHCESSPSLSDSAPSDESIDSFESVISVDHQVRISGLLVDGHVIDVVANSNTKSWELYRYFENHCEHPFDIIHKGNIIHRLDSKTNLDLIDGGSKR